jgi:hypothetical protein
MDKVVALGLALGAILSGSAALAAGPAAAVDYTHGFQTAKFKVEVKGKQTTILKHTHEAVDGCDVSDFSSGREVFTFHSKPIVITAVHSPGSFNPEFFAGRKLGIPTRATVERSFTPVIDAVTSCEEENGGGVVNPEPPDCGKKTINPYLVKLEYADEKKAGQNLMLSVAKNYEDPFHNCSGGGALAFPFLIPVETSGRDVAAKLSQDDLFDPGYQKWISIAKGTDKESTPNLWVQTRLEWDVSFTRLKE